MFPRFPKRQPDPVLTTDIYARWLRAQRPPFALFLTMSEVEQEAFAQVGDAYTQDAALMIGYAVHNPEEAEDSRDARAGDALAEESLARQLAAGLAQRLQASKAQEPEPVAPEPPRETMAGIGARKAEAEQDNIDRMRARATTLFGRPADEVVAP